jgi:predicted PurR-regulated permease PerM
VLASLYTLYFARGFFLPLTLGVLLSFLLRPPVRFLSRRGIPEAVGAALVLLAVLSAVSFGAYRMAGPAAKWLDEAPATLRNAEKAFAEIRRPVEQMRDATQQVQEMTTIEDAGHPPAVEIGGPRLSDLVFGQMRAVGLGAFTVVFLLYFLLAAGDLFLLKLVRVLPRLRDRIQAVEIVRRIQRDVSRHLFTITLINSGLGASVGLAAYLAGMPNALLWGVMAACFNFVPYVGSVATAGILFLAALTSLESVNWAFTVVGIFLALTSIEGFLVTPLVLGRRLMLNPVVIFIGVIFWGWLWGVPGAVLAVPILATTRIICENIERLNPLAEFLGP